MKRRHTINKPNYFSVIDTPTKAYFVGFIAADGCIQQLTKSSKGLTLSIDKTDVEILNRLKNELDCSNPIYYLNNTTMVRFQTTCKQIVSDLIALGITERKSKTLLNFFDNIPLHLRKYSALGYFDGDGGFILPKGKFKQWKNTIYWVESYSIHCIIRGTRAVLEGLASALNIEKCAIKKYDSTYRLVIARKTETLKLVEVYQTCPIYLTRKYDKIEERLKTWNSF